MTLIQACAAIIYLANGFIYNNLMPVTFSCDYDFQFKVLSIDQVLYYTMDEGRHSRSLYKTNVYRFNRCRTYL